MKCDVCSKEYTLKYADFDYTDLSGLDKDSWEIMLKRVEVLSCECGSTPRIPNIDGLHHTIGLSLIRDESPLDGSAVRFSRKTIGISLLDSVHSLSIMPFNTSESTKEDISSLYFEFHDDGTGTQWKNIPVYSPVNNSYTDPIVTTNYCEVNDAGYRGMYNMRLSDLKDYKRIPRNEKIPDHMGRQELAANLFRVTQTEEKIKRDKIRGQKHLEDTAYDVGCLVRQIMVETGGTVPEDL